MADPEPLPRAFPAPPASSHPLPAGPPSEQPTVPLTGLALILAIAGLLFFMALPSRPLDAAELAAERVEVELRFALEELRGAIGEYRLEHESWPGCDPRAASRREPGAVGEDWLVRQLAHSTGGRRRAVAQREGTFRSGPYLSHGVPVNPLNRSVRVHVLGRGERMPDGPVGDAGWIYAPLTGEVRANVSGFLPRTGERIFDL